VVRALSPDALRWQCDPALLDFQTTDDVSELNDILGQERALDAVQFGIQMRKKGYNLYALGPPGIGKRTIVQEFIKQRSAAARTPPDWCYVHNFDDPHSPKALELPPERGNRLRQHMESLIEDLRTAIPLRWRWRSTRTAFRR